MHVDSDPVARISAVDHRYGATRALAGVSAEIPSRALVGLIGPDGVGKSTLMGLIAGARRIQTGRVSVLGGDMADPRHRRAACLRIAYMPQGLGRNLYADLTVRENLDFFGRLFGHGRRARRARMQTLLRATGLEGFEDRAVVKLSGGMKQKLGLCCALIHDPDFLILDEPTTGVDPLSRAQFWQLIGDMRRQRPGLSLLVSTAYMDEAERFDHLLAMNAGQLIAAGPPAQLEERTGTPSLDAAFVRLLPEDARRDHEPLTIPPRGRFGDAPAIVARDLTRRFGDFTAVDRVSFSIERGEIFGFLGSNGCGKTTTMKVLTGLLPASEGEAELLGRPVDAQDLSARRRIGYMSQAFSLYGELSVRQNLELHARLFRLPSARIPERIRELLDRFDLTEAADHLARDLPLGIRQRLSLAVAIVHEPELLILDEPTSGVDPIARDELWKVLVDLSRQRGVTIFLSTHFMSEATRCGRISLMHAGAVLACDTPDALARARGGASLEQAFIAYIRDAMEGGRAAGAPDAVGAGDRATAEALPAPPPVIAAPAASGRRASLRRLLAYAYRESLEVLRDPVRLAFAFVGSALLMLIFAFGITADVENVRFAALDLDRTPESRAYLSEFGGSRYFSERPPLSSPDGALERLRANDIALALEIPPHFGRDLRLGRSPEVSARIDAAMPFRAETILGYVEGVHSRFLQRLAAEASTPAPSAQGLIEPRFRYNPTFESIYTMAPGIPPLLLILFPAILTAVSVAREKELGSITNYYVTPTTRLEFLLGKQLPYVLLAFLNFLILTLMAVWLFGVPIKGSGAALTVGAFLYVMATTAVGLVLSSLTSSQVAAIFATSILTMMPTVEFSGLLQPVSTLEGPARVIGAVWPTTYYLHLSVGAFTKALGARALLPDLVALGLFVPGLTLLAALALRSQQR